MALSGLWRRASSGVDTTDRVARTEARRRNARVGRGGDYAHKRTQTKRPNMYRVLLLNDDYTPMEFVVSILQAFFNKDAQEAMQIMSRCTTTA